MVRWSLLLLLSACAGCNAATDDRTCDDVEAGSSCFCQASAEWSAPPSGASVCDGVVAGGRLCCEGEVDDYCYCTTPVRCALADPLCRCGQRVTGGTDVAACAATATTVCCLTSGAPGVLGECTCGYGSCAPGMTEVSDCTAATVSRCGSGETRVSSCLPRGTSLP